MKQKIFNAIMGSLLLLIPCIGLAVNQLRAVRVSSASHPTRVVMELSQTPQYNIFTLNKPFRVVIDVKNTQLKTSLKGLAKKNRLIKKIRTSKTKQKVLRVVLDLQRRAKPKAFVLQQSGHHPTRLIIDLASAHKSAPVFKAVSAKALQFKPVSTLNLPSSFRDILVVIDPGHGGKDPGATGARGSHEKHIVLSISKALQKEINQQPHMQAILTRHSDYYLSLRQRLRFARKHKADVFIAIHADAYRGRAAQGASVFMLSQRGATSEAARWLAERENRSALVGGLNLGARGSQLRSVLIDLSQTSTNALSMKLASAILQSLDSITQLHHSRVERAGFVVLKSPDIPSILVETGFLSNQQEEAKLRTPVYQQKVAQAIWQGLKRYFYQHPPAGTWLSAKLRGTQYVVKRGDSLSRIASKFKLSLQRVQTSNRLRGTMIHPGQRLLIPPA